MGPYGQWMTHPTYWIVNGAPANRQCASCCRYLCTHCLVVPWKLARWCVPWILSSVSQRCPRLVLQKWHPSTSPMFEGKGRAKRCLYQNAALCTFTWEPGNFDSHFLVHAAERSNLDIIWVFLKPSSQVNKHATAFTLRTFILVFWKLSCFVF